MCGIAGVVRGGQTAPLLTEEQCRGMEGVMRHRGPDRFDYCLEEGIALFHWRLSVIDLSRAGNQPMTSHSGRYRIVYNGEIYNAGELRERIEVARGEGFQWRGHSDTEILLEGFAEWGKDVFPMLNGMFAIAIYDTESGELSLARDRVGIKPLYFWQSGQDLLFSSEAKFFFKCESFGFGLSKGGIGAFLLHGHGFGTNRIMDGVTQLEPGETIRVSTKTSAESVSLDRRRFVPKAAWVPKKWSLESASKEVRKLIEDSVARQLVADVPVGVFLSGGVDSSVLAAVASKILGPSSTKTFTLGYEGFGSDFDEIAIASNTAKFLGVEHYVLKAQEGDLLKDFERMVWQYDEPFADGAALNVLMLSRLVRQHVTVALAGEGSDELFGGYRRYQVERMMRRLGILGRPLGWIANVAKNYPRLLSRRLSILCETLGRRDPTRRYSAYFEGTLQPNELLKPEWQSTGNLYARLGELYPGAPGVPPVGAMCLTDQQYWLLDSYMEKSDKGSMSASLEVRVPFLDNDVVDFANSLPDDLRVKGKQGKRLLRYAFADLLPESLFVRFKRGFAVPCSRWLRQELREFFSRTVLVDRARVAEFLNIPLVERVFEEHVEGRKDHSSILWRILVLEVWLGLVERGFVRPESSQDSVKVRALG